MESESYLGQRHGGGPSSQGAPQSTLNHLLSTPSSFSPSMNQMYPGHPMQHQSFDGSQGYPGMQYGQQNLTGMGMPMQQQNRGSFGQLPGPPGASGRLAPSGAPMMRADTDKIPQDWMAFQQQQSAMPYNSHMMQKSPVGMMGQPVAIGGGPQMEVAGTTNEDAPNGARKASKKSKARRASVSSTSPTPPSSRSSAQHIQQQVLQEQMALPTLEPEAKKTAKRSKKKKMEAGPSPAEMAGTSMDGSNQELESNDGSFASSSSYFQQQQQQQQPPLPPQRPQYPHGMHQFPAQGGTPGWPEGTLMPPWMHPAGPGPHMGMTGAMAMQAVAPAASQMEMNQQSILNEPISHTPSPSHSSSSSQNVYSQNREFPFSAEMAVPPTVAKAKKSPSKERKASVTAIESESGVDPSWPKAGSSEGPSHTGTAKSSIEKLSMLYEMGDEPDRRGFLDNLVKLCEENSVPIINIPVIAKVSLDLYKFYKIVQARGGYIEVHRTKGWKDIAGILGIISPNPNTAYTLKKQYIKFVLPYEARFDRGGVDPDSIVQAAESIPAKSPSRNRSGESKKRSRTHVSSVEQLSGVVDGPDGPAMLSQAPPHAQGPYPPGPGHSQSFAGRGLQQFLGPSDGQQYSQTGYPPQQSAPNPGYGGAQQELTPQQGGPGGGPFWLGQGQMAAPSAQVIPFDGRGLQAEVLAPEGQGRGEEGMQQRSGQPVARHMPYPASHGGMDRQHHQQQARPNGDLQGGPNGGRGMSLGGMGHDGGVHDRRTMDSTLNIAPAPHFMTTSASAAAQISQQQQGPFQERHLGLTMPIPVQVGQTQMAGGGIMNNGIPRLHAGKDGRTIPTQMSDAQHRHHRLVGSSAPLQAQLQPAPAAQEVYNFPPDSVEATDIILRNRARMTARDVSGGAALDVWKLHMRMRSGLLAESGWAFEMLNIYTCDEQLCGQFNLANLPAGFLDTVVDWFQVAMHRLINSGRASKSTLGPKCVDLANESEPADAFAANCRENSHLRTHFDYAFWGDCEGRERIDEIIDQENEQPKKTLVEENPSIKKATLKRSTCSVPFFLNLTSESEEDIGRKCVAISTSIRNLSAVHGNETHLSKNQRLLSLLGRFITFSHSHLTEEVFGSKAVTEEIPEGDEDVATNSLFSIPCRQSETTAISDDTVETLQVEEKIAFVGVPWWQDVIEHVRENLLVTLANIAGHMDLAECDEAVCRPILEGLIHWSVCPSSMAQEVLPTVISQHQSVTGELSAKCLAMETISKLTVTDANIDLLIAAPSGPQLSQFIHQLIQLLPPSSPWTPTAHLLREFAMVILCSLVTCEERVCLIVAEHPLGLEYLTMMLEEFDRMARHGLKFDGYEGHLPTPNSAYSAMMLRKVIDILLVMAELPAVRSILEKYQLRFWNLVVGYHLPDAMALSGLTKILFLLSGAEGTTVSL